MTSEGTSLRSPEHLRDADLRRPLGTVLQPGHPERHHRPWCDHPACPGARRTRGPVSMTGAGSSSQDGAARCQLDGGNAPAVYGYQPATMSAAERSRVLGQDRDDVLDDVAGVDRVGFVVLDVEVVSAGEPDAQHDCGHGHTLGPSMSTTSPTTIVPTPSGTRLTPNQTLPSHLRCRARVRIGSLPLTNVSGSIVVMAQRSHPLTARNAVVPITTCRQSSSAKGTSVSTTTLGRNRSITSGVGGPSPRSRASSSTHTFSLRSDAVVVSSRGYPSAKLT